MKVYGNTELMTALSQMVESGHIPHAMLLHQDDGGGAFPLILNFLEQLYGGNPRVGKLIHPDIHFVFPVAGADKPVSLQYIAPFRELVLQNPYFYENELYSAIGIEGKQASISVNEARSILDRLSLTAVEGGYRTVVMYLPEKMNQEAANRLLKAIEEPEPQTQFILITRSPEKVLQTIASRCQRIQLGAPAKAPEFDRPELLDGLMDAIVRKDLFDALEAGEQLAALPSRESAKAFCRYASDAMRNVFLAQQGLGLQQTASGNAAAWASRLPRSFARNALGALDAAYRLVERNVNMKIIFADLANKLYRING
jgi:DNA polymerase-3 subunit delta'